MRTLVLIAALLVTPSVGLSQSRSFAGEIMDSPCASMGSHDRMMEGVEAKDAKDCSEKCVRLAASYKYVLYDPATKTTYLIDNQQLAAGHAGRKVNVKGTYDAASKMIHVESIDSR